jgi:hypothetical protein
MDTEIVIAEVPVEMRVIPLAEVGRGLGGVCDRTVTRYCQRFGISIVNCSRKVRGLLPADYIALLRRMQKPAGKDG